MSKIPITLSYGGGVQSVAICVLIAEGTLPVPDLAAIVDTGRERKTTWEYLHCHMQPYLDRKSVPLKIEIVPHSFARVDLFDKSGLTIMPAYTAGGGRLASYCSGEWKRDAMERWLRSKGVKECDTWIGFSIDEHQRVPKKDHRPWCHLQFPLIEKFLNRAMCKTLIQAAGLPVPHKSRCLQCPHQNDEEWQEVKDDPEEWAAALSLEKQINESDPEQSGLFLYSGRVPLEMADFRKGKGMVPPAKPCESGNCWT